MQPQEWISDCQNRSIIVREKTDQLKIKEKLYSSQSPQPALNKKYDLLVSHHNKNKEQDYENILICSNEQQAKSSSDG